MTRPEARGRASWAKRGFPGVCDLWVGNGWPWSSWETVHPEARLHGESNACTHIFCSLGSIRSVSWKTLLWLHIFQDGNAVQSVSYRKWDFKMAKGFIQTKCTSNRE